MLYTSMIGHFMSPLYKASSSDSKDVDQSVIIVGDSEYNLPRPCHNLQLLSNVLVVHWLPWRFSCMQWRTASVQWRLLRLLMEWSWEIRISSIHSHAHLLWWRAKQKEIYTVKSYKCYYYIHYRWIVGHNCTSEAYHLGIGGKRHTR